MKKTYFKGVRAGNYAQVKINTEGLEELQSALLSSYITRVGILGSKTNRTSQMPGETRAHYLARALRKIKPAQVSNQTNAEIGLLHEKGSLSERIPRRSFLEMPLVLKSEELLKVKNDLQALVMSGGETLAKWHKAYVKLGMYAENIIQEAFETRGFGHWPENAPSTISRKGSSQPLVDTGQLRRSITSDVISR